MVLGKTSAPGCPHHPKFGAGCGCVGVKIAELFEDDLGIRAYRMQLYTDTTAIVKKAQQRLYFLHTLRKVNLSQQHLRSFYRCSIESVLTYGILSWFGSSSAADRKSLQRIIKIAHNIINQQLPTMDTIFNSRCLQKTHNILKDSFHCQLSV